MQAIYSNIQISNENANSQIVKDVASSLTKTKELYFYIIKTLVNVCNYAQKDALKKAGKHLPTADDLNINTKLSGNSLIKTIIENNDYKEFNKQTKFNQMVDADLIKKLYGILIDTPEYIEYTKTEERIAAKEKEILNFILSDIIYPNELFEENTENYFTNWDDDADMLRTILIAMLNKIDRFSINGLIGAEKNEFALELAKTYSEKNEHLNSIYIPKLKNWDEGRIAILDKIIIGLGVAEFLYFETIPTKVTMNEYIDLAKHYSTKQSGQFINGILDNIHTDLQNSNKIVKKQLVKS